MRVRPLVPLLVIIVAGCVDPVAQEGGAQTLLLKLDGRWAFDRALGEGMIAEADAGRVVGLAVFTEGILEREGARPVAVDAVGLDPPALDAWREARGWNATPPERGRAAVDAAFAAAHGLALGDAFVLRAWVWPAPLVATFFEMDRTRPCEADPEAKLCFLPFDDPNLTRLRLRVDEGAHDLAFLPDLAELGAAGTPAWWNGTFTPPEGARHAFSAFADARGAPRRAEVAGALAPGAWEIAFRLEANGTVVPAGVAGIVRVREPGYGWFDDRLLDHPEPVAQARAVLERARPVHLNLTVGALADLGGGPFPLLLHLDDARRLEDAASPAVGALVVRASPEGKGRFEALRAERADPPATHLRLRPLPEAAPAVEGTRHLLFRAPPDVDATALPPIEGARLPTLAVALEPSLGEDATLDGAPVDAPLRVLAHAGPEGRAPPWRPEPGSRWPDVAAALENLTRARTLVAASPDVAPSGTQAGRLVLGDERTGRILVVAGVAQGGPEASLWASPSLVAGAGEPSSAIVLLAVEEGHDPMQVAEAAEAAYAPFGLARLR